MKEAKAVELTFPKLNHFWLDSGLIGLIKILNKTKPDIQIIENDTKLVLKGEQESLQNCLEQAYDQLIADYYNLSTEKQRNTKHAYNFYYNSEKDNFIAFPKKKSPGIASVIFSKAPRPSGTSVKWYKKGKKEIVINGKKVKKNRHQLPESHQHIQKRMTEFLDANKLDITTAGLLIDGENQIRPKVNIKTKITKAKGICYLCGESSHALEDAKETVFPLITGSAGVLSFNSQGHKPEKVCWKCSFLGKFVPANGFYCSQGGNLYIFLPYSVSLTKMSKVWAPMQEAKYDDPKLFKNFDHPLGGYFQRPFEVSFAFFYNLYKKVLQKQRTEQEDKNDVVTVEELFELILSRAPLEFYVLNLESKGQTKMCKMAWPFRDSVYFFRLIRMLEQQNIKIREIMRLLTDFTQTKNENKTIIRNRVCERILKKQSVLDLIEKHIFHAALSYIGPLLDFVVIYEPIVRSEDDMTKEEQETAVKLGKRLGIAVGKEGKKGDLFALRKTRTKIDFLEQLNRLQFKLGKHLVIPPGVYEGRLNDDNFAEFKQFNMISAVNSFNAVTFKKGDN
jgi:hypothetical protein